MRIAVPYQHVGVEWVAAVSDATDSNAVIVPVAEYCGSPGATVAGITDGVAGATRRTPAVPAAPGAAIVVRGMLPGAVVIADQHQGVAAFAGGAGSLLGAN